MDLEIKMTILESLLYAQIGRKTLALVGRQPNSYLNFLVYFYVFLCAHNYATFMVVLLCFNQCLCQVSLWDNLDDNCFDYVQKQKLLRLVEELLKFAEAR